LLLYYCFKFCSNVYVAVWRSNRGTHDGALHLLISTATTLAVSMASSVEVPASSVEVMLQCLSCLMANLR
jgi:hypothetical protein